MKIGVKLIPYNLAMRQARRECGLTQKQLADQAGMGVGTLQAIELLYRPVKEVEATEIALALGYDVDYLFPSETRDFRPRARASIDFVTEVESLDALPAGEVEYLLAPGPEQVYDEAELKKLVVDTVDTLRPRHALVIKLRFGLLDGHVHTLEETARKLGVTREYIRQMETMALKRLRHPRRCRPLAENIRDLLEEGAFDARTNP